MILLNTTTMKEISKYMMITGAAIFTCGLGINLSCRYVEKKELDILHKKNMLEIKEQEYSKQLLLEEKETAARTEKDILYAEKLRTMNKTEFAKFHAEATARANEDVIRKAEDVRRQAELDISQARITCDEKITRIQNDCLRKIEEANKKRDEAVQKYEAIDNLFTNKKEILKAKEALDAAIKKDQKSKEDKEELLKSIKDILE